MRVGGFSGVAGREREAGKGVCACALRSEKGGPKERKEGKGVAL